MSTAPKKIALWGYGRFGKRLLETICTYWRKHFIVTMVFDQHASTTGGATTSNGIPLLNTTSVLENYRAGRFEAVLVSIAYGDIHEGIFQQLEELGVPTTALIREDAFRPFEEFEDTSEQRLPHGFTLHEYRSLLGFYHPLYQWQTPFYCFDNRGRYPKDMWYMEHLGWDPLLKNPAIPADPDEAEIVDLPGSYCLAAYLWARNYWHFTFQSLDRVTLMEESGYTGTYLLVRSGLAEELLALVGVNLERVLWLDELDKSKLYRFERLAFVYNGSPDYDGAKSAAALMDAARRIESQALCEESETARYPSRLFVKRIGTRKLLNADDVIERNGFTTIVPEDLSVAEQVRYFNHADIVICPHGANSTNSLYMRPGSVFIELFSDKWANPCCVDTLYQKGIHYLPLVKMSIESEIVPSIKDDFEVDTTILQMLITTASHIVGQDSLG